MEKLVNAFKCCRFRVAAATVALVGIWGQGLLAAPRHPWPTVKVPGVAPMAIPFGRTMMVAQPEARADRLLVRFHPGYLERVGPFPQAVKLAVSERLGAKVDRYWPLFGMASLEVAPEQLFEMESSLRARPEVAEVGLDVVVHPAYVPDTPEYRKQYHHPLIGTPLSWDAKPASAWRATVIAVVDTGVYLAHPDLAGKIWKNAGEIAGNRIDDDSNGFVDDIHGWNFAEDNNDPNPRPNGRDENGDGTPDENASHGTLVAGIAGAAVFDNYGTAGVYPNARIMAIKIFPADGATDLQTVVDGINYAVTNGAEVINLSVGAPWSTIFNTPIAAAHSKGIVVVAAAGNSTRALTDSYLESPVCNDGASNYVIGVGYTDQYEAKGRYSNWDTSSGRHWVDLCAPGERIYGPACYDPAYGFTEYFYTNTGTSFAAPMVAGAAALVKAVFPSLTNDQIGERLRSTADNIDRFLGTYAGAMGGRLYCPRALGLVLPPRPVTNLAAQDTPRDQGGSITLNWTLSFDDGSGSRAVTGYLVLRRAETETDFTQITQVPAGNDHYADSTTRDGTKYYYKVGATDGTLVGYCDPVGPVTSRDDLPPPPVTNLTARDRTGDNGGAIELDWRPYSPPSDCAGYNIYRDTVSFSDLGNRSPIARVTDPSVRTFTDTSVVDYTDYYYAVVALDRAGNYDPAVTVAGPVCSMPNTPMTIPAGLRMMGAPAVPYDGDPVSFVGAGKPFKYANWDVSGGRYYTYAPGDTLTDRTKMALGRGFWLYLPADTQVLIGGQTASSGNFSTSLRDGWVLLGNPYFADLDVGEAQIVAGTTYMSLRAAEQNGYVSTAVWVWDPAAKTYLMKSAQWTGQAIVSQWAGFWFRAYKTCTLVLVRPTGAAQATGGTKPVAAQAAAGEAANSTPKLDWRVRLKVQGSGGGADVDNFIAVARENVVPAPEPPAAPGAPRLFLRDADQEWAAVARRPGNRLTWRIVVQPAAGDERSWLQADEIAGIPREYDIILRDLETGRVVDLRRCPRVEVVGAQERQFELSVTREAKATLTVTAVSVRSTAGGVEVAFTLSAPAYCDIEVLNIAGRTVRRLRTGQLMASGQNAVVWDARGESGTPVPRGIYLVKLCARSQDGTQVQAVRTVTLQR
ncbi:MAG: S8 family serine peptidase [Armatimonadetes bacterium]|nr:S8 family serine peptidase [Armatimonadota bacterium]